MQRFWSKVDKTSPDGCWEWTASKSNGYGRFRLNGKRASAHRVSWQMHTGKTVPQGMYICHTCDNPGCVNPKHLFLGTATDNKQDCLRKGRSADVNGEKNAMSVLTKEEVLLVRSFRGFMTGRELAKLFNVSPKCISKVQLNQRWKTIQLC